MKSETVREKFGRHFMTGEKVFWNGVVVGSVCTLRNGRRLFLKKVNPSKHFYRNFDSWCFSVSVVTGALDGRADAIVMLNEATGTLLYAQYADFRANAKPVVSFDPKDPQIGLKSSHWKTYGD